MHSLFQQHFPNSSSPLIYSAPGRVNLIGEHTDYNAGFVLPMAIEFSTQIALSLRMDNLVRVYSKTLDQYAEFYLTDQFDITNRQWYFYVAGVLQLLNKLEPHFVGADIVIDSSVPIGAGLSSSASLEMAVGFAYLNAHQRAVDLVELAKICQQAEHQYAGTKCGIMDQFICGLAQENHALLIDCESLEFEAIPLVMDNISLLICDTGVHHELASSAYNTRRQECELGAKLLHVPSLRYANLQLLADNKNNLSSDIYQRCHHVVSENERTLKAVNAMKTKNWPLLGELMLASHRSLQIDYQVSCNELDFLVDTALTLPGVYGARMTGGGFGGCTINLIDDSSITLFKESIIESYQQRFGFTPKIYQSKACRGVASETNNKILNFADAV